VVRSITRAAACVGLAGLTALAAAPATARAPRPDLVVAGLSHPATSRAGEALVVTDVVRNTGGRRAGASRVAYRLSLDGRLQPADPRLAGTRSIKPLRPRKRSSGRATVTVPADLAPAVYRLFACADGAGKVRERSDGNTCRRSGRTLRVTGAAGPPTPQPSSRD